MKSRVTSGPKHRPLATRIQTAWLPALLTLAALSQAPLGAQSLWTTTTGNWNSEFNWDPTGIPLSDPATHLIFQASSSYTTTNDIGAGTFTLNRITVNNMGTGTVRITGATTANTFTFAGINPTLDITGSVLFTGLMEGSATITKTGLGTFIHDSDNAGFTGTIIIDQGTFMNRATTVTPSRFNPVSIVVNNGGTYQFGAATAGDPNLPNSTFITVNTGGMVNWQESEDFGGFHLQGGTINLQQGNANAAGTTGGPQIWTNGTLTGGSFALGGIRDINKSSPGTVFVTGNVAINSTGTLNIIEGTISLANTANLGTANVSLGDAVGATAGTLVYNGATAARVGAFTINTGGGTIDVASATTVLTLTGAISGTGNLTKVGPGKLRLAGALGSSGSTTVTAGALQVEPVSAFGSFIVAATTALSVNSGIGATSFNPTSVNLADGATLQFDLDTNTLPAAPLAVIGDPDGLIRAGTPTLRLTNLQAFANGNYTLVDYDGSPISSGFNLALPGRTLGNLIYDTVNTRIDLAVTGTDTVKWVGSFNDVWDLGTSAGVGGTNNWKLITAGGATNFIDTDTVTFDDTATRYTVNVTDTVQPFSMLVNAATDYTISGSGKVSGSTALTKSGTGTLTLATDNDYTGGTTATGGTLQIGNGGTTGSVVGTVTLNGGALAFNRSDNFTFNNTIVVAAPTTLLQNGTGTATISTPLATTSNEVNFGGTGNLTMGATVSGNGILNKNGTGTLTLLANNNSFTGTLNVNAGTLLLDDLGAGGDLGASSIIINNGGTFVFGPGGNADLPDTTLVTVKTGGLFRIEQGENFGGVVLDGGELRMISTVRTGVNTTGVAAAAGAIVFDLRSGTITADITPPGAGGALNGNNGGVLTKSTDGTVTIGAGVTFNNALPLQIKDGILAMGVGNVPTGGAGTITMGDATTIGTLQINGQGTSATGRAFMLEAGGGIFQITDPNTSVLISGTVSGPGPLIKTGPGTLVLNNGNDYLGPTSINVGTLEVTNVFGSATGSGPVSVESILAGDGEIITGAANSVVIDGTFRPGATGGFQGIDFAITAGAGGSTIFGATSIASFDLWSSTGTDQSTVLSAADLLRVAGNFQITAGATLKLTNPNGLTFQDGDVFRLFDWTSVGTLSGNWAIDTSALNLGNLSLDASNLYTTGTLAITAIPEPSSALLALLGLSTFVLRRRRPAGAV